MISTMKPKSVLAICCGVMLAGVAIAVSEEEDAFSGETQPISPEKAALRTWFAKLGPRPQGIGYGSNEDGAPAISVYANDRTDLSVLRGAPVRHIQIMGNMPLLASGKVMKLGPLAGMPLESLWIWKVPLDDLSPLEFTQLKKLLIMGAGITDISPLKDLPLTDLELWCTDVSDISPLKGMQLNRLNIETSESARVTDLSPLKGMELESLQFLANGVTKGIKIVRRMKSLKEINRMEPGEFWKKYDAAASAREMVAKAGLKFTRLDAGNDGKLSLWFHGDDLIDLAPLKGLPVDFLGFRESKVSDLRPLAGLPLHGLCIKSAVLTDLSPLRATPLTELYLDSDNLSDLTPLRDTKLETISLRCPKAIDLSALRNLPLKDLNIRGSGVTDLSPLEGLALEHIQFDPERITKGLEALRAIKSLRQINRSDAEFFWDEHDGKQSSEDDPFSKGHSSK